MSLFCSGSGAGLQNVTFECGSFLTQIWCNLTPLGFFVLTTLIFQFCRLFVCIKLKSQIRIFKKFRSAKSSKAQFQTFQKQGIFENVHQKIIEKGLITEYFHLKTFKFLLSSRKTQFFRNSEYIKFCQIHLKESDSNVSHGAARHRFFFLLVSLM